MDEKLLIKVEADGTHTISRQFEKLGAEGDKAAARIQKSFSAAMSNLRWQTQVALNSTKLAEKARVDAARASAQEVSRLRRSETLASQAAAKAQIAAAREAARAEASAAREAARAKMAAARQASRLQVEQARAARRAEIAERTKIRDAKKDATFGLGTGFSAVAGLLGLGSAVSGFIQYSDAALNVSNRLKQVTSSSEELNGLTQELRQSALDSRSEYDLTTRTYARLAQSTKQLSLGQRANLSMTETLTKAIAVSGATGAEAHATLIQLSQAMASNRLSADEFRSVSEQLPIILDLLADSTGRARTELKGMGEDGKLGSQTLALALLEGLTKIREQFDKTTPTIEQSWENIKTQTRFAVEEFNKATGAAGALTKALQWMSNNMDTVQVAVKALGAMIGVYLVAQIGFAASAMKTLAAANPWVAAAVGLTALISLIIQYRNEINETAGDLGYFAMVHSLPAGQWTPEMKNAVLSGKTPAQQAREAADYKARQYDMRQDVTRAQEEQDDIIRLKMQNDLPTSSKTKGGGSGSSKHITTFGEALQDLLRENMALQVNVREREKLNTLLGIQDKIQRQLTPKEKTVVQTLYEQNRALKEQQTIMEAIQDMNFERLKAFSGRGAEGAMNDAVLDMQKQLGRQLTSGESDPLREAARLLYRDQENSKAFQSYLDDIKKNEAGQEELRVALGARDYSGLKDKKDFSNARSELVKGARYGETSADYARSRIEEMERLDPATSSARVSWLEEMGGDGEFAQNVDSTFDALTSGFADATAAAIVFQDSFSASLNALGKQIQAQIISTLIQAGIRMAILGAAGGGSVGGATGAALAAIGGPNSQGGYIYGRGYASGGFTGDMGRSKIAGYVHGGEYVLNAQATQRIGKHDLDVMNKTGNAGGGRGIKINFIDQAGVKMEAQYGGGVSRDEVTLIARREAVNESGRAVAGNIRDPNSHVGKALRGNTTTRYQR